MIIYQLQNNSTMTQIASITHETVDEWRKEGDRDSVNLLAQTIEVCIRMYKKTGNYDYLKNANNFNRKIKEITARWTVNNSPQQPKEGV